MEDQTESIQQSSSPQQSNIRPQTPQEHKLQSFLTSRLFPITLVLLITFILGYAGIYLGLNARLNQMAKPNSAPQTPPASLTQVRDETANWKTYANTSGKYFFKYPKDYKFYENQVVLADGAIAPEQGTVQIVSSILPNLNNNFSLSIKYDGIKFVKKDLNSVVDEISTCSDVVSSKGQKYSVDGREALLFSDTTCGPSGSTLIYTADSGIYYVIEVRSQTSLKNVKIYVDQILSTFRFLDQTQVVPTTNPEGKFCGGIAANLPENQCPLGYKCQLDGKYPDAGGKCVKQ